MFGDKFHQIPDFYLYADLYLYAPCDMHVGSVHHIGTTGLVYHNYLMKVFLNCGNFSSMDIPGNLKIIIGYSAIDIPEGWQNF